MGGGGGAGCEFAIPKPFSYGGSLEQSDWLKIKNYDTPITELIQYVHAIELHTTGMVHAQLALANTFAA